MLEIGVGVAVLRDGKILLTQREVFEIWRLPRPFLKNHLEIEPDLCHGEASVVRIYTQGWPFDPSVDCWQIDAMRDESGLSRPAFNDNYWGPDDPNDARQEVPPANEPALTKGLPIF